MRIGLYMHSGIRLAICALPYVQSSLRIGLCIFILHYAHSALGILPCAKVFVQFAPLVQHAHFAQSADFV